MLVDRLAVLLFERSQQTVKTMETVQGLLSSGALEQDHEGYALPEPTAAELRARSVKVTTILATLDLARPSAALEAQLEARVADSRRLAVERAVAWEIEDEVAAKTGKAGDGRRAALAAALDALEAKLDGVGAWLARNAEDLEGMGGAVRDIVDDNASLETHRCNLRRLDAALARIAGPALGASDDEDDDDGDEAGRGLALGPEAEALLRDPEAAVARANRANGDVDELAWRFARAAEELGAARRRCDALGDDDGYAALAAVRERRRQLAELADGFARRADQAVKGRVLDLCDAWEAEWARSDAHSGTLSAAALATALRRRQADAHAKVRGDAVCALIGGVAALDRRDVLASLRRTWARATRNALYGPRVEAYVAARRAVAAADVDNAAARRAIRAFLAGAAPARS